MRNDYKTGNFKYPFYLKDILAETQKLRDRSHLAHNFCFSQHKDIRTLLRYHQFRCLLFWGSVPS